MLHFNFFFRAVFLLSAFGFAAVAQEQNGDYHFFVDLTSVKDDKLQVELVAPTQTSDAVTYNMPKIVPGTYHIYDFGRFLSEFKAFDKSGKELSVTKNGENAWDIKGAKSLYKITYRVDDTFDSELPNTVFEPGGTNIEAGLNYVLNTHTLFGYFEGQKDKKMIVNIQKPADMYGATSMIDLAPQILADHFEAENYMRLADSPIMYCRPDTASIRLGDSEVLVSVYSPGKLIDSKQVAENLGTLLEAQKEYMGGVLPVKKYAFIIYLHDKPTLSGSMGALEHSYSSLYSLPDYSAAFLMPTIRDIAAHEFFHIITPLSIHSEEIHDFDYQNPKMSKHLWLYEGVTEYFAGHMQVQANLIKEFEYFQVLRTKMSNAKGYKQGLAFTEMSKGCLDKYEDQYGNVYEKGALIGMCLDIWIRNYSEGKNNLSLLMRDLSKIYGKDKAFKDEDLFAKITEITGLPELQSFFERYVAGSEELPFKETFAMVGFDYDELRETKTRNLGDISFYKDAEENILIDAEKINDLGKKIGFESGDQVVEVDGIKVNIGNFQSTMIDILNTGKSGDQIVWSIKRKNKRGKYKPKTLTGEIGEETKQITNYLMPLEKPGDKQNKIKKDWLGL